jgi:hypothetical protein
MCDTLIKRGVAKKLWLVAYIFILPPYLP